jgi:cob(I)alamin adenosyltransferase
MKLYTKTGDDGTTGLFGGRRVSKCDPRVQAYGEVDELCAVLGWCAVVAGVDLSGELARIQADLFAAGAELAEAASQGRSGFRAVGDEQSRRLESLIDSACAAVEPLRNFILPGGSEAAARLQVARGVCRRAERALVELARQATLRPALLVYFNRLGDLLFAWARLQNKLDNQPEVPWIPHG